MKMASKTKIEYTNKILAWNTLSKRPDVRNCAVIGIRDMERSQGHYPMVLVEFAEGVDTDTAWREIYKFCDETVEERGKPVAVIAVDEIPLT